MNADQRRTLPRPVLAVASILLFGLLVVTPAAVGDTGTPLSWSVKVDGRAADTVDANNPLSLHPDRGARVEVSVTNRGNAELSVRSVKLDGQVIGLTFYSYVTRVDMILPPRTSATRSFDLDLGDLAGQAVGLIPSRVSLLSPTRTVLAQQSAPVDVHGSARSVYGVFGFAVAGITAVLLVGLLMRLGTGRLPPNRWRRAMLFLPPGIGIGMTLTFTLSAARLMLPSGQHWGLLVLVCAAIAFVLGYFSPLPEEISERDSGSGADESVAHRDDETVVLPRQADKGAPTGSSRVVVLPEPADSPSRARDGSD